LRRPVGEIDSVIIQVLGATQKLIASGLGHCSA